MDLSKIENLSKTETQKLLAMLQPKLNKFVPHVPTVKQAVFMNLECREAFFGGAAGGGKSDALLMDALQHVDKKNYAAIIFRKSYADLTKPSALIPRSQEWLLPFTDTKEVKWNEKDKRFEFLEAYGRKRDVRAILQFGYLESESDRFNYQGGEYQYIGFDELTHIHEVSYLYMFSRLRRVKGLEVPLKMRGASNPPEDDRGQWVYNRFVNPAMKKKGAIFIPASLDDNPFLDTKEYEESLEELDPVTRERLRHGNWEVRRQGNMFKRDWFEIIDTPPMFRRKVRFWDMAATEDKKGRKGKGPDYTVGLLMSEANGIFYIEDILRVRARPHDTDQLQKKTAINDGYNTAIREEQEPGSSGTAVISVKGRSLFKGYDYKGIRSTGNKVLRANPVSSAAERGDIKILRGCRNLSDFLDEAESFPGGVHDDMIDGMSGAYNSLREMPATGAPIGVGDDEESYWETLDNVDELADRRVGYWRGR